MSAAVKPAVRLDVPALQIDSLIYNTRPMSPRARLERRVVWNLLNQLQDAGATRWSIDDGGDETACEDIKEVMELAFNLDECHVYCDMPGASGPRWMYFVFGNDGWDALADYIASGDEFSRICNAFDGEAYV